MKMNKSKIVSVCVMMLLAFSLASCGISRAIIDIVDAVDEIADVINEGVAAIVQEVTGLAIDEMGGGPVITLVIGDIGANEDLHISLANNAASIQMHDDDMIRVDFSPPITGNYVMPTVSLNHNRIEITEPISIATIGDDRPGVVHIYLPKNAVSLNFVDLNVINGAVRIIGDGHNLAESVIVAISNGIVELRDFDAYDIIVRTTNGTISGSDLGANNLELRTTNGIITLIDSRISNDLTARTTNGSITLNNVDVNMDRADLNATNGIVTVR